MPVFDECCILIPASTLEDFPAKLSDDDARSLLGAWTALWHPRLLAQTEQTPAWYRADAPPEPAGKRIMVAPQPSLVKLPDGYEARAQNNPDCQWITGKSRDEMIAAMGIAPCNELTESLENTSDSDGSADLVRRVGVADFYAAGYAALQIQVMTRRLRYTSNLDEIFLQTRIVTAAKAFLAGDASAAIASLHEVFDSLAEERDHYFTSDPHLIDLTLSTASTVEKLVKSWSEAPHRFSDQVRKDSPRLATPTSVLIDSGAASSLTELAQSSSQPTAQNSAAKDFIDRLKNGSIGWAGGGPDPNQQLDAMTLVQAQSAFQDAHRDVTNHIGAPPAVYGRIQGATPSDMTKTIIGLGYRGMIPIDFAGGSGFGDEAKVILQSGGAEIEALTAKPIDANSDAAFLAIGAKLGEAIDSGEVATALLAHWPEQGCDSFHDLRRVGSWCVALGRFWRIDRYFTDGEHPYHHGGASAASPDSAQLLTDQVESKTANPLSSIASAFRDGILAERDSMLAGMTALATGKPDGVSLINSPQQFAEAIGAMASNQGKSRLLVNPHSIGVRDDVVLPFTPKRGKHVYASSSVAGGTGSTVDIPACGFVTLRSGTGKGDRSGMSSARTWLRNKWLGSPTSIAMTSSGQGGRLQNEFLEATIHPESGGISGVYSGATRGNRFSMRLIAVGLAGQAEKSETQMKCEKLRVTESTLAKGVIEATGRITDDEDKVLATFTITYTLLRGSRVIVVSGDVKPQAEFADDPWTSYLAARVAVASDASTCRVLLRDKVHRGGGRRLVSPLGLLIDEVDRQTTIGSAGLAFHRKIGERFFDTLLSVKGETQAAFTIHYGFDVSNPITIAKSMIAGPVEVQVDASENTPDIGWMVHSAPKDLSISSMEVFRRSDGKLAAMMRVIQTRPKACKATLRFFRDVRFACLAGSENESDFRNLDEPSEDAANRLKSKEDQVTLSLASHAFADLLVVFDS
ncbi:hypothetical protein [Rubripirellula reticaptiva]|uniref:Uncharacterized protein n=1 Tax=Rubripirellula reticaptiva TaxID=2528013 RepID=A0A5C6ELW9_9BACT|nr:hypothetical protein [Rubripirellula reticaptiva]TWU49390.1 hypothetical protein Poly59_40050 [Rubripirellula reticaptiva]